MPIKSNIKIKNLKIAVFISACIFICVSCTTSRSVIKHCKADPQKINLENINGIYEGKGLWNAFHESKTTKADTLKLSENVKTKIYFDGKQYITATVYDNDVKKSEITLKAKVYKDYVSVQKRHKLLPFPPIYFYSDVHKFILYNDSHNNISLCGYGSTTMVVLIFSGGKGGYYSGTYKRTADTEFQ